jgi:1-acyl-sn-glycerol-3-phosphate acyltransferase
VSELKPQKYKEKRPAEQFQPFHEWARTHGPGWIYELVRLLITPVALIFYRTRAIGTANVPAAGPVILAPNHFSNMDHFFCGVYLRRKIQFMAKSQLFGNRIGDYIFRVGGVFPVMRGHRDDEPFITAHAILDRGGCILIYAEGGRSRSTGLGEPRPGVGRIALETGMPVVPVAIHGSRGVRDWKRLRFPKITVQYGEPMTFPLVVHPSREEQQRAAEQIFTPVRHMYAALDQQGRRGVLRSLKRGIAGGSPPPGAPTGAAGSR